MLKHSELNDAVIIINPCISIMTLILIRFIILNELYNIRDILLV